MKQTVLSRLYYRLIGLLVPMAGAGGMLLLAQWMPPASHTPLLWALLRWLGTVWCYLTALILLFIGLRLASGKDM